MMMIKQTEKKIAKNCQRKNVWTELNNVSQKRQDPLLCTKAEENTKIDTHYTFTTLLSTHKHEIYQ